MAETVVVPNKLYEAFQKKFDGALTELKQYAHLDYYGEWESELTAAKDFFEAQKLETAEWYDLLLKEANAMQGEFFTNMQFALIFNPKLD